MDPELKEFAELVNEMRHAQKDFFRRRVMSALQESMRHEKKVDAFLERILGEQRQLF